MTHLTRFAGVALALVLVLTGCSRGTLITLDLDTLALVAEENREGTLALAALETVQLPESGASTSELGLDGEIAGSLQALSVSIAGSLTPSEGAPDATITVAVFVGSTTDDLYALDPKELLEVTLDGPTAEPFALSLTIDAETNAGALALLQSGDAVIGFQIEVATVEVVDLGVANGATVAYAIDALDLTASVLLGDLLPF